MTKKVYRTAQGKTVDMGAMLLQNEHTRAVGNMGVNARGEQINAHNQPVESRNKKVTRSYAKQATNVSDEKLVKDTMHTKLEEDLLESMDDPMDATEQFVDGHGDVQEVVKKDDGFSLT